MAHDAPPQRAPVAIVGGGPVGLSLALGLARQGVRSVLVERKERTSAWSKAPAVHVRTREVLRQWGVETRFLETGILRTDITLHSGGPGGRALASVGFSDLDAEADRPGLLVIEQGDTERLLLEAVRETGLCDLRFATEAVGLEQDGGGVRLTCRGSGPAQVLDALFAVGCDGAGSFTREKLGLSFDGFTYSLRPMLADVRIADARDTLGWPRLGNAGGGVTFAIRLGEGLWRLVRLERGDPEGGDAVPEREVGERLAETLGAGPFETVWASRFRIHLRSAPRFRSGRVLLAGDAAHIHSPAGGLGMNAGIQDAHNLAWKLAAALRGGETDRLLDSYDAERRAVVVEDVSRYADLLTRLLLQAPAPVRAAALLFAGALLSIPPIRRRMLRRATMIGLGYRTSPLLDRRDRAAGLRLPNPVLRSPEGKETRLYDLLGNDPALLAVAERREMAARPARLPVGRVIAIGPGGYRDPSGLIRRLLGGRDGWILVRPDLHVAWARGDAAGLEEAVRRALGAFPGRAG